MDSSCCKACKHWHGQRKLSKWGGCNYIIGELNPRIFRTVNNSGHSFSLPFDPHDRKYYSKSVLMKTVHRELANMRLPDGVRLTITKEKDLKFSDVGSATVTRSTIFYFQTEPTMVCEFYEEV